VGAYFAYWQ